MKSFVLRYCFGLPLGLAILLALPLGMLWSHPGWAADTRVSTATGNLLVDRSHGGDGSAWGKAQCANCHVLRGIHRNAPLIRNIVRTKGYSTCTGCHGTNGAAVNRRCLVCHNATDLPAAPYQTGRHRHDFTIASAHRLGDRECLTCHVKSDMDGRFEPEVDLTRIRDADRALSPYASISDFCLRCHNRDHRPRGVRIRQRPQLGNNDPLVAIEDDYTLIDQHGFVDGGNGPYRGLREAGYRYPDVVECTDCHAMHGTRNGKLILDDSRKGVTRLSRALRSEPFAVDVRNGNYAPLCVLCHNMERPEVEEGSLPTSNGLAGVHDVSSDCTQCHVHGEPVLGGL